MTWSGPYIGPGSHDTYIRGAADPCVNDRCKLGQARRILDEAHSLNKEMIEERAKMVKGIAALWCHSGHSFSEQDPGRRSVTVTAVNPDTGAEEYQTRQFCGGCAPTAGLMTAPRHRPAEFDQRARPEIGGGNGG